MTNDLRSHRSVPCRSPSQRKRLSSSSLASPMTPNSERLEFPFPGCETCSLRLQQRHRETANTQLAAIVTASADAIVSVAPDGKFLSWNPGAEKMFGYSAAEAVGRSSSELIVPPSRRAEHEALLADGARRQAGDDQRHRPASEGRNAYRSRDQRFADMRRKGRGEKHCRHLSRRERPQARRTAAAHAYE